MRTWWGRSSSSKEAKTKSPKESFINTLHKKFRSPECKSSCRSEGTRTVSGRVYQSRAKSRSSSPPKNVVKSQSLAEWPQPQPLPLPDTGPTNATRAELELENPKQDNLKEPLQFLPLPKPACIAPRMDPTDSDGELAVASVSTECSIEENDYDSGSRTAAASPPRSNFSKNQLPAGVATQVSKESKLPRRRPLSSHVPNLQVPPRTAFYSAPNHSMYSPTRSSPIRPFGCEQVTNSVGKLPLPGSGQCSSPGSAQTSEHNSVGGDRDRDMSGHLFWQPSRGSPEYSPNPSPRMTSPSPGSRIHSGAVTPLHPRVGGGHSESKSNWPDDAKQRSHRLPLPPISVSISSPFSHPNSAATSPSVPRSPGRVESLVGLGSCWKKGKLLGRGTFGHVYVGFNSETGEMCAMKEVTLFSDDAKSKESAKQLGQEIALLSRLKHHNIVQYYGTETVGDRLYIYLEYVSGGSIHKILQDYGRLGESAIRSYTKQILSGLAYLHAKNTVHRDIKGANILVDPNGRVKLADFGMAKHITGYSGPLSFKGSPYWMAPEVIKNSSGCSLPVDIWSLGCTVLEMATSKPPWSQYEGIAAMFKIGNSKELPTIPDYLSDEGKEFVMLCLQRNPHNRPTAAQLLEHSFVKSVSTLERKVLSTSSLDNNHAVLDDAVKSAGTGHPRNLPPLDIETLATHSSRFSRSNIHSSDIYIPRNISCPVSPVGSPLLRPSGMLSPQYTSGMLSPQYPSGMLSPQYPSGRMSPSPISSPRAASNVTYWDPDILQLGSRAGLVDRVSQQLATEHVKLGPPPFDPSPPYPLTWL